MLTNEIISILMNSLTFVIFTSFQETKSIPGYRDQIYARENEANKFIVFQ